MPLLNGIDAAYQLKRLLPDTRLLFLSMHGDATYVTEAFRAGAAGYVLKRSTAMELLQAIRAVLRGQLYISPMPTKDMLDPLLRSKRIEAVPQKQLTIRQREVLQLVAEGRSLKEIAAILCVSVKTVEFYKTRIVKQLRLSTTADLTKYALTHGLVPV